MTVPSTFPFRRYHFTPQRSERPDLHRWQGSPWRRRHLQYRYPVPDTVELPQPLSDRPPSYRAER